MSLHIITPFSRIENKKFYIENLKNKNIIWHPIVTEDKIFFNDIVGNENWLVPYVFKDLHESLKTNTFNPNVIKINKFIETNNIIDNDMYCFMNDDDWLEDNVIDEIDKYNEEVIFISMKRGNFIPKKDKYQHGINTLFPFKGVGCGSIGFEQIFVKGHVLKQIKLDIKSEMPDGTMAEGLQKYFKVKYITNLFALFNYLEPGRWDEKKEIKNMETIVQRFERVKKEHRDISEHLDTLLEYANKKEVKSIVELGVNEGISTTAFCLAIQQNPEKKFTNVDVHITTMFKQLIDMCENEKVEMNFILANDLEIEIPECDLLFVDTLHDFKQLFLELKLHANKSRHFCILHDTETFAHKGITPGDKGLKPAIDEFLLKNKHWKFKVHYSNNNGLTIVERI